MEEREGETSKHLLETLNEWNDYLEKNISDFREASQ
jgi:hypothetical protein